MSFASQVQVFAAQASRERSKAFCGETDADGFNLKIGTTRFRAAFTRMTTALDAIMHGRHVRCQAKFLLPDSLNLTLDVATLVTHLDTGDVYEVVEFRQSPGSVETSVLLRRQEP